MITDEFRKKFKEDLGDNYSYTPEVRKILAEGNRTNRDGKPFSSQSIRNVFNGLRANDAIEIAIGICYKRGVALKTERASLRGILNNEKSTDPDKGKNR